MVAKSIEELRTNQQTMGEDFGPTPETLGDDSLSQPIQGFDMSVKEYYNQFCIWISKLEAVNSVHYVDDDEWYVVDFFFGLKMDLMERVFQHKGIRRVSDAFRWAEMEENSLKNHADVVFDGMSNPESKHCDELQESDVICDDKSDDLEVQIEVEAGKRVSPIADHKVFEEMPNQFSVKLTGGVNRGECSILQINCVPRVFDPGTSTSRYMHNELFNKLLQPSVIEPAGSESFSGQCHSISTFLGQCKSVPSYTSTHMVFIFDPGGFGELFGFWIEGVVGTLYCHSLKCLLRCLWSHIISLVDEMKRAGIGNEEFCKMFGLINGVARSPWLGNGCDTINKRSNAFYSRDVRQHHNHFSTNQGATFLKGIFGVQSESRNGVKEPSTLGIGGVEFTHQLIDKLPQLLGVAINQGRYADRGYVSPLWSSNIEKMLDSAVSEADMLIMPLPSFCMNKELFQPSIIQTSEDKVVKKGEDASSLKQNSQAEPASKFDKSSEQAFTGLNSFSGKFYTISKIEEVEIPSFEAGVNSSDMSIHSNVDLLVGNVIFLFDLGGCLSELPILLSFTPNMLSTMFRGDIVDDDLAKPPLAQCVVENFEWYAQGMFQGSEIGEGYEVYSQSMFRLLHSVLEIGVANSVSMIMLNWGLHINSPTGVEMNHVSTYARMKLCGYNVIFGVLERPIGEKCVAQRLTETTQAIPNAMNPLVWNVRGQWSDSRLLKTNIIEQILLVSLTKFGSGIFFAQGCMIWFIDMLRSPEADHFGAVAFLIAGSFQVGNCTQARETLQGQSVLQFTSFQALSPRAASHIIQSEMENDCHTFIIVVEHFVWDPGTIFVIPFTSLRTRMIWRGGKGMYARGFEDSVWRQCADDHEI